MSGDRHVTQLRQFIKCPMHRKIRYFLDHRWRGLHILGKSNDVHGKNNGMDFNQVGELLQALEWDC